MVHHRDTRGPVWPCCSLQNEKHSLQWGTIRAMFMGGIANSLNNAHVGLFTVIWSSNPMLLWVQGSRLWEHGLCYGAVKMESQWYDDNKILIDVLVKLLLRQSTHDMTWWNVCHSTSYRITFYHLENRFILKFHNFKMFGFSGSQKVVLSHN